MKQTKPKKTPFKGIKGLKTDKMLESLASFDSKLKKLATKSKNKPSQKAVNHLNEDLDMDKQIKDFNHNIKSL